MAAIFDGRVTKVIDGLRFRRESTGGLFSLFRFGLVDGSKWAASPAMNPRDFQAELMAEVDCCWMQWLLVGFRPESELVALTTALVAVVAVHRDVN